MMSTYPHLLSFIAFQVLQAAAFISGGGQIKFILIRYSTFALGEKVMESHRTSRCVSRCTKCFTIYSIYLLFSTLSGNKVNIS